MFSCFYPNFSSCRLIYPGRKVIWEPFLSLPLTEHFSIDRGFVCLYTTGTLPRLCSMAEICLSNPICGLNAVYSHPVSRLSSRPHWISSHSPRTSLLFGFWMGLLAFGWGDQPYDGTGSPAFDGPTGLGTGFPAFDGLTSLGRARVSL